MNKLTLPSLLLCVLLAACGGSDDGTDTGATDTGATDTGTTDTGTTDTGSTDTGTDTGTTTGECDDAAGPALNPDYTSDDADPTCSSEGGMTVRLIQGKITTSDGAPLECAKAQVCIVMAPSEIPQCLRPVTARSDGTFDIQLSGESTCVSHAAMRFFHPSLPMASNYLDLHVQDGDATVMVDETVLYDTVVPATLPEKTEDTALHTVAFDGGLEVDVQPELLGIGASRYTELQGVYVAPADAGGLVFVDDVETYEGFFGFSPEGNIRDAGFALRIANSTELAAGATVDLFALGGIGCTLGDDGLIPEAEWQNIGTGTVDGAGETISFDTNLPCMTWMGYKAQ